VNSDTGITDIHDYQFDTCWWYLCHRNASQHCRYMAVCSHYLSEHIRHHFGSHRYRYLLSK